MKKLLSIISVIGLTSTTTSAISCDIFGLKDKFGDLGIDLSKNNLDITQDEEMYVGDNKAIYTFLTNGPSTEEFENFLLVIAILLAKEGITESEGYLRFDSQSSDENIVIMDKIESESLTYIDNNEEDNTFVKAIAPGKATINYSMSVIYNEKTIGKLSLVLNITVLPTLIEPDPEYTFNF